MPHNNGRGQCKNLQEIDPPKGNPHIVYFPYKPGIYLWEYIYTHTHTHTHTHRMKVLSNSRTQGKQRHEGDPHRKWGFSENSQTTRQWQLISFYLNLFSQFLQPAHLVFNRRVVDSFLGRLRNQRRRITGNFVLSYGGFHMKSMKIQDLPIMRATS